MPKNKSEKWVVPRLVLEDFQGEIVYSYAKVFCELPHGYPIGGLNGSCLRGSTHQIVLRPEDTDLELVFQAVEYRGGGECIMMEMETGIFFHVVM